MSCGQMGRSRVAATLTVESTAGTAALTVSESGELRYEAPVQGVTDTARILVPQEIPRVELLLRSRETKIDRVVGLSMTTRAVSGERRQPVRYCVEGRVDPGHVGGEALSAGVWDVFVRLRDWGAGNNLTRRVGAVRSGSVPEHLDPGVLGVCAPRGCSCPYWTEQGNPQSRHRPEDSLTGREPSWPGTPVRRGR